MLQRYYPQQEQGVHLRDYWRIILKHRWAALTFFAIIVTTATIYTFSVTPTYRATATIKIDRERPQILSFQEIGSAGQTPHDPEFMGTQQKLLQSRTLAKRVVETVKASGQPILMSQESSGPTGVKALWLSWLTHLFGSRSAKPSEETEPAPRSESGTDLAEEQLSSRNVDALLAMLTVEPIRASSLVKISFTTPSPQRSALLANSWARAFIGHNLEMKYNATSQASEWLSKQLQDILAKLEQSEAKLHEFAKQKKILTVGDKKDVITTKLAYLTDALSKAQDDRIAKEALENQTQGVGFESIPMVMQSSLISSLKIEYYNLDAEYQRLRETYKPDYPKMVRMREGITHTKQRLDAEIRRIVDGIKQEYEAAVRKEGLLQMAVDEQKRLAVKLSQDFIQYDILKREVDTNNQIYASILERQKQAGISQGLATSNVQIVDNAEVPWVPFSPNKTRNVLIGIILGLTVGIGMAFFFDYLDNTVKSTDDLERALGIPSLALIPSLSTSTPRQARGALSGNGNNGDSNGKPVFALMAHSDLRSMLSESFRTLRTSLLFSSPGSPPKSILFTSARPSEGKTGLSINTAITLSQLGGSVLLIDADMRRPSCHTLMDLPVTPGLSDYLTGNADLVSVIQRTPMPDLYCLPAGTTPINPAELLASSRMKESIELLSQRFDYIIVDSPPIFGIADALILSTVVKGVILVVHGGRTPRETVQRAFRNLVEVNATILGTVLNNVDVRSGSHPSYYHYNYYHQQTPADAAHPPDAEEAHVVEDDPMSRT